MAKKIYDIKHPRTTRKTEKKTVESKILIKEKKRPAVVSTPAVVSNTVARNKKDKKSLKGPILITVSIVLLLVGIYLFFKLPKADITIWPKVETLSFQQTIVADKNVNTVDYLKNIIPATYFQATKTVAQDFPATGNATNEGQAHGTITIYNKYDPPKSFTFKEGTRFMSDSGKLFIAPQKIVIPAATKSGSKIKPGTVNVEVRAVDGGTAYNIAPSNFSVPGLKGTAYYYSVYASSTSDMTGGYEGKVKKVTDDDIQEAKNVLIEKATLDSVDDVKKQISSEYILLDSAILSNAVDASTKTKSGTVTENFNYSATVETSALAFKKSDLDKFINDYVVSKIPAGKTILEGSSNADYSSNLVDISGGKATLNLNISSSIYQDIDRNNLILSLLGENDNQIRQIINNNLGDQVSKVEIKFWPFWVKSAPKNQKTVNVFLKF
ncbi:MAG: hypothetical protein WC711_01620 [Candidatus Staskawiczbacteria bacterium]|jgi:hypothetical protein